MLDYLWKSDADTGLSSKHACIFAKGCTLLLLQSISLAAAILLAAFTCISTALAATCYTVQHVCNPLANACGA